MSGPEDTVRLAHGGGGRLTRELVGDVFARALGNPILNRMDDAATLELQGRLAFTIDSHVVSPLFFPGGDIGRLSLTGTVNDLAVMGAAPLYISAGFIIEDGFAIAKLERIAQSMRAAAREARVQVVAGDTKVVEQGAADGLFITTSGIGVIPAGVHISAAGARPGDAVILSGSLGDHGIAILSQREGMKFDVELKSDCAPLGEMVRQMLEATPRIHAMRDPTRGGLAALLNEIALAAGVSIEIDEAAIPMRAEVRGACELLGLDPLILANEGKLVAFVASQDAERLLEAMHSHPLGTGAAVIGRVLRPGETGPGDDAGRSPAPAAATPDTGNRSRNRVYARTVMGSRRVVQMPAGEQLPRIC
ncbi:MAG: hydrogenase expression/formation protein HypE [Thermoleophilia bacterium]